MAASERHKELKAALDAELAAVRRRRQGLSADVLALFCMTRTERVVFRAASVPSNARRHRACGMPDVFGA